MVLQLSGTHLVTVSRRVKSGNSQNVTVNHILTFKLLVFWSTTLLVWSTLATVINVNLSSRCRQLFSVENLLALNCRTNTVSEQLVNIKEH